MLREQAGTKGNGGRGLVQITQHKKNITASACNKDWWRALQLLWEFPDNSLEPDVISYNTATNAFAKGRQWKEVLRLLVEMVDARL